MVLHRPVELALFKGIESLNERVKEYDERMEKMAKQWLQYLHRWASTLPWYGQKNSVAHPCAVLNRRREARGAYSQLDENPTMESGLRETKCTVKDYS
jgi:hypothetical protein